MRSFLLWIACMAATGASAQKLVLMTEEYPPFNMSAPDGALVGISTDVVRELMREAQVDYSMSVSPWMRATTMARTRSGHCAFSMSRLADREADYRWVGPIAFNDWFLFARKSIPSAPRPASLDELKWARIGSYLGAGGLADLKRRGFDIDVAPKDDLNPRKLQVGRIDYWASGKLSGLYRLKVQKIEGIEPVLKIERSELYLACHPATPAATIDRLNQALAELTRRGLIARIYARYGYTP
jgi:polar amino acid transport system substrate-binding protein